MSAVRGFECRVIMSSGLVASGVAMGYAESFSASEDTGAEAFYQMGSFLAQTIKAGGRAITGSLSRAYINSTGLKLLLRATGLTNRSFQLVGSGANGRIMVSGCVITTWNYDQPRDDWVMESLDFVAKQILLRTGANP